ncbi:unnamed protein product [Owenia fusiformis]|uniref:SSD domain-containing protein n=1 Tax=Owenia fusiformis TaxID=6347 RepID=A0A8S4NPB5_OWEFU|nr:unnamed protein product [Owenia fusiformis]
MMKTDCIEKPLAGLLCRLGKIVARYPWPFIVIPVIISGGCGVGLLRLKNVVDTEYLYTPDDGPAKEERAILRRYFTMDWSTNFQATRSLTLDGYARVIFIPKDGNKNALSTEIVQEIIDIDAKIRALKTTDGKTYDYYCAGSNGCYTNNILEILNYTASNINNANLTFPMFHQRFLGTELGGVKLQGDGELVESAEAIRLQYYVRYENASNMAVSDVWLEAFKSSMLSIDTDKLNVHFLTSKSLTEELQTATTGIISKFSITYTILCVFSILSCFMFDWVRSKPWLGFIGAITACLAILTSLGLLCAVGVEFTSIVATMPFLIIGIGLDDMFIQISAWRQTSYHKTVEERMGLTFKDAAMSITLTSLTNTLAFCIGAITSFPSVRIFCLFTGVAVIFCYIYQITFFGGCMSLIGRREHTNRHCYACIEVLPKEEAGNKPLMYRVWCTGGSKTDKKGITVHSGTEFFKTYFGPVLMKPISKVLVILIFLGYLGVAIWGVFNLKEGLELKNLAPDNSYAASFYQHEDTYFNSIYGLRLQVAITQPLDYWNISSLGQLDTLIDDLKQSKWLFTNETLIENWISDFSNYLEITRQTNLNSTQFIDTLKGQFLEIPGYERYKLDIVFSDDGSAILASRILIQSRGQQNANQQREFMKEVRDIAKSSELKVTVFHPAFIFFDQYSVILVNTLQNIGVAVGVMLFVALLLVPHPLCAIWVTLSVCSISTGVIGYMTHWDVNLDSISMINIILCIGFSVDYSAHIAYHFVISEADIPKGINAHLASIGPLKNTDKWIIVTTISSPTEDIKSLAKLTEWQLLVVADTKTPKDWHFDGVLFLSLDAQRSLRYKVLEHIPYSSYSRKNIGYLFAIQHGAKIIYETDDDNHPTNGLKSFVTTDKMYGVVPSTNTTLFNPYAYYGQPTTWPRGYPLEYIGDNITSEYNAVHWNTALIQQGAVHGDPDVDAIYRLTRKSSSEILKITYDEYMPPLFYPKGTFVPWNSQNTLFHYGAFWGLILPVTVTSRVTDIWRSYFTQTLLWLIDGHLSYMPPNCYQFRNYHSYIDDAKQEDKLYYQAGEFVKFLSSWKCKANSLPLCIQLLADTMVHKGFWDIADAKLVRAWLQDLLSIGYEFPIMRSEQRMEPVDFSITLQSDNRFAVSIPSNSKQIYIGQKKSKIRKLYHNTCNRYKYTGRSHESNQTNKQELIQPNPILLLIIFNTPHYETIPYIEALYDGHFVKTIYCGPEKPNQKILEEWEINFITYEQARDYFPGSYN